MAQVNTAKTVDIGRLRELAEVIREEAYISPSLSDRDIEHSIENLLVRPLGFNIAVYNCHTAGCIAGWAVALYGSEDDNPKMFDTAGVDVFEWASQLLGLPWSIASNLFLPPTDLVGSIGPENAANVLERIADALGKGERFGPEYSGSLLVESFWFEEVA